MEDKTIKEFIEYCAQKHNYKYDYSKVSFKKLSEKIEIICPEHSSFFQIATLHKAYGCSKCAGFGLNNDERIMRLKLKHGDRYDYSKVFSSKNSDIITIICSKHGEFQQVYGYHLAGNGCQECAGNKKINTEDFIKQSIKTHGDKYDYSLTEYRGWNDKVDIICSKHGIFSQTPHNHKRGDGCPKCSGKKLNTDDIIESFKTAHGDKYDYSLVVYKGATTPVTIICNKHGEFKQAPIQHKNGKGCIKCKESKGETAVRTFLEKKQIKYIQEYRDKDIYTSNYNRFDFYLPEFNIYVEFQGIQHYKPIDIFGGEESYTKQMYSDLSKMYSVYFSHNAELISIPFYYIDRVDEYLTYCLERFI